jgi:hypothetical protein
MANLFDKAKNNGTKPASKSSSKTEVIVNDKVLEKNLRLLANVNSEIDALTATAADLTGQIKPRIIEEFVKVYNQDKKYPGSFNLKAGSSSLMVVPTDKYLTIDKDRAESLQSQYGTEIVEEKDTYIMDNAMIEKYGDIISKLITNCKDIATEDKEKLIRVETKISVRKGTIKEVFEKFPKAANKNLAGLVEDIQPVFQMKNVKGE